MVSVTITGDPNWAEIVMLVVQALALGAAVLAFVQLKKQVGLQQAEMHSTLRPLVVVQRASVVATAAGSYVEVQVQNVGPGPAMDIEILGWLQAVETMDVAPLARDEMDRKRREVDFDKPVLLLRPGALGSNQKRTGPMSLATQDQPFIALTEAHSLAYMAKYVDVYDVRYPRAPRAKWVAGHVTIDRS